MSGTYMVFDQAALNALLGGPDSIVGKEMVKRAVRVTNHAKRVVAVDTGRLRSSVVYEIGQEGQWIIARIGTNVEYAPYLEFGTRRMSAQPFLRPALAAEASRR